MKLRLLIYAFVLFNFQLTAQGYLKTPSPNWIAQYEKQGTKEVSKYDVETGFYYTLLNYQYEVDKAIEYNEIELKVLSNAGVESASQIQIVFDTTYQKLQIHALQIKRKGKTIDILEKTEFNILSNELELNSNIVYGLVTAHAILEDIRVDDDILYEYSIVGRNPIMDGNEHVIVFLNGSNPIGDIFINIQQSKSLKSTYRVSELYKDEVVEKESNGIKCFQLAIKDVDPLIIPDNLSPYHNPYFTFEYSSLYDWNDYQSWANDLFQMDRPIQLDSLIETIISTDDSKEESITKLIDFVQSDIRYMGVESGIGSHKPRHPHEVIEKRYGDCKDKSLLLTELFKKIGIEKAFPALVNSSIFKGVQNYLPGTRLFNHCIVQYEYEGEEYWIDPSTTFQGGSFKDRGMTDYGYSLIVDGRSNELKRVKIDPNLSHINIEEYYELSTFDGDGALTIKTEYKGLSADYMRSYLEYNNARTLQKYSKEYYGLMYPEIQNDGKIKIKDDLEANKLYVTEKYNIGNIWRETALNDVVKKKSFNYEPISLYEYITNISCDNTEYPIGFAYPSKFHQKTSILLPDAIKVATAEKETSNSAYEFKRKQRIEGKTLHLEYSFTSKTDEVDSKDFRTICLEMNEDYRTLPIEIYFLNK